MSRGGIAKKLVDFAYSLVSEVIGGLAIVTIFACTFFAAISGSSTATTVAIGGMMVPEMIKKGYDEDFSLAVAAAGGVIGPIIPPSIGFILYGVATETSIADLFLAGIIPGILMCIFLTITVYILSKKKGYVGETSTNKKSVLRSAYEAKWALLVPVIILGGIYGGIFTPTEAGAVACIYAIIIALFVEKSLNAKELLDILSNSSLTAAMILFLVATASIFGKVLTFAQVPQMLTNSILAVANNGFTVILLMNLFLLVVGCIMEASAAILILAPLLLPIAVHFGFSPIQFGVILIANLTIGAITPPVGCCLFAASAVSGRPIEKIAVAAFPMLIALLLVLILICVIPGISTFLPSIL